MVGALQGIVHWPASRHYSAINLGPEGTGRYGGGYPAPRCPSRLEWFGRPVTWQSLPELLAVPSFRSDKDTPDSGYQDWLRALEKTMRGDRAGAGDPTLHGPPPRSPDDHVIEGEIVRGTAPQSMVVREEARGGVPGESDPRVWDLWKPYLLPVAVCAGVGLFVVLGVLAALRWYTSEYSGPSQQQTFDSLWEAHRRGDDITAPETLEGREEVDQAQGAKATPEAASPPEGSPNALPEPEHPDGVGSGRPR